MLTVFFAKRLLAALVLCAILMWGDFFFLAGFAVGCAAALCKMLLMKKFPLGAGKAAWISFTPFLSLAILGVAAVVGLRIFVGCAAGMLSLPTIILINAVTEFTGISHNEWKA